MGQADEELERQRAALRERLLAEAGIERVGPAPIPRLADDVAMQLTDAQRRLWFLHHFDDDPSTLNVRSALRIRGPFDPSLLEGVLGDIVERHDILHWAIANEGGEPVPRRLADARIEFSIDEPSATDVEHTIAEAITSSGQRVFDLDNEVPVAVHVTRLGEADHLLTIAMHHIVSDDRSQRNFIYEILAGYGAAAGIADLPLPELPIRYRDYAAWQDAELENSEDAEVDFWAQALAELPTTSDIPADRPRPLHHVVESGSARRTIDAASVPAIRSIAANAKATPFMVLLTAYATALGLTSGQDDLAIGTPVAGRPRSELEPMLGVFINTLVLRLGVDPTMSFNDALASVQQTCLEAFDHQTVPFERVLDRLQPPRDPSRTPFFSTMFNMTSASPTAEIDLPVDVEFLELGDVQAKFDLTLYVADAGDRFEMQAVYNRVLFDVPTIERFLDLMAELLTFGLATPDTPLREVLHSPALDTGQVEDAPIDATWPGSVISAIERHADERAGQIAIEDPDTAWTYAELARDARRIAARLHDLGAHAGQPIAILGERSAALAPAVAGALAAGTPYVIIDPALPAARVEHYLRTVAPRAVVQVVREGGDAAPAAAADVATVTVGPTPADTDASWDDLPFEPFEPSPDDPACLTFTSGSTGEPRAVVGAHGSLTAFFPWMSEEFGISADDRFSLLSGLSHDPIQRDLFWAFWVGATVVAPDPASIPEPGYLADWLRSRQVSVAHLTPAMGALLTDTAAAGAEVPLRRVLFIGDRLRGALVAKLDEMMPAADIINLYGTTETQRASTWHRLSPEERRSPDPMWIAPLGTAMPGCQALVVTASGDPVPPGAVGQLSLRSPWLALGYVEGETIDSSAFSASPSGTGGTERTYRTGDLARRRVDGTLEHRGRTDDQIKIRGFRVEPLEIEAALTARPEVDRCVVVVLDRDDPALGAYVVPSGDRTLTSTDAIRLARTLLPPAMVPNRIEVVDTIPLTANGKTDIGPLLVQRRLTEQSGPTDEIERSLLTLWGEVLGRRDLGIHDDFFEAGGYSLLATRLFARIDEEIGITLPVALLFSAPTVASLAERIRQRQEGESAIDLAAVVPIKASGDKSPFFYVMPYTISVLQLSTLGEVIDDAQPLYGIQPLGLEPGQPIHTSVEQMATHYLNEIKQVQPEGPYRVGGHCAGSIVAFELCRQIEASGGAVSSLILVDNGPPHVERPKVVPWRYIVHRMRFFASSGRLWHALRWQFELLSGRFLLLRLGTDRQRRAEAIRASHRAAHDDYTGGMVEAPIFLLRSEETIALGDREWHLRWRECTTGPFSSDTVTTTHAMLLERPYVEDLAEKLDTNLGPAEN